MKPTPDPRPLSPEPRRSGPIVVIGSINLDLVCRVERMPAPGQTVGGEALQAIEGGKGANQAVAAARLGGEVHMVGRVGDDSFGERLRQGLRRFGVGTRHVSVAKQTASGTAMILVDRAGQNSIVISPGANAAVTPADVDAARPLLARASVVLLQLEIPLPTVRHAIALCRRVGAMVVLDPAPARDLDKPLMDVDLLVPNELEAQDLVRISKPADHLNKTAALDIAGRLLRRGPRQVIVKLAERGSTVVAPGWHAHVPAFKVKVEDSTAAGDAFAGGLAVALSEKRDPLDAIRFASAAGAMCCTKFGAQPAMPSRAEVEKLIRSGRHG